MASDIITFLFSKLYDNTIDLRKKSRTKLKDHFFIIPGKNGYRWIIPQNPQFGLPVLKQWHPYNLISKIKWNILVYLYANHILKIMPGIQKVTIYSGEKNTDRTDDSELIPVIYIGTPSSQQKAVATLIDPVNDMPVKIVKIALKKSARDNLTHEADMLKKMDDLNVSGIPRLISIEDEGTKTVQTVIHGRLTSRNLKKAHIDWLLKLPRFEKTTTFDEQKQSIQALLAKQQSGFTEMETNALANLTATLQGKNPIPYLISHGDFAPWNLKWLANDMITAIDWEDSNVNGLPLWDLSHFFCIQAHLFGSPDPYKMIQECPLVILYIKELGLDQKDIRQLYSLYLIKKFISLRLTSQNAYGKFLIRQIHWISQY